MELGPMLPELLIVLTAIIVLLLDLFFSERQKLLAPVSLLGTGAAICAMIPGWGDLSLVLGGQLVIAPLSQWFKIVFLLGGAATIALVWSAQGDERLGARSEFFTILLLTQVGMMVMISAADLISLYISLELSTIPMFGLVAWRRGRDLGSEAALKYVVSGALASGLLLFGVGLLYGLGGSMQLAELRAALTVSPALLFALGLILVGIGFKMALVPFHFWAADVYQGAPTAVTAYLSVASKAAGLAFMLQIFSNALHSTQLDWSLLMAITAVASMTLGNLVAIVQTDIKRFMAFSSISQAGNIVLGFLGSDADGGAAMLFYALVFVFTNISLFGVLHWFSDQTGRTTIDDYRGLSRTQPLMALVMTLGLFGLAGIPPLAGFVGKFFLFSVAAQAGMHWLVAVAALNATVSLFYYLRVVRAMYIEPPDPSAPRLVVPAALRVTLVMATMGTVLLGFISWFYESIRTAAANWVK